MKPDLTFRRSVRMIAKRWWLLVLGGLIVAAAAFIFVERRTQQYTLTTTLTLNDVSTVPKSGKPGFDVFYNPQKFPDAWVTNDIITQAAARGASDALGGHPSAAQIYAGLSMVGTGTTTVQVTYTGGGSKDQVTSVLRHYVAAFINQRTDQEQQQIDTALSGLQAVRPQTLAITRNESTLLKAEQQLPGNFSSQFDSTRYRPEPVPVPKGGPPLILAVLGGFFAGAAVAALIALLLGRMDKRVRRPDDIEVVGVPVVDVDSDSDPASIQLLRSELELAGMGTRLGVIAVTRATRDEGSSGLALALARTFAAVGTPTVLVSADLRERTVRSENGLSAMLDSSASQPPLMPLANNLQWLPEGTSTANPETLFSASRVERIVRTLREQAGVVVIDTPAVLEDAETLPLIACSDIVLLTVRPGLTMWNPLGSAITLIQRIAKRPLHICYDRAPERSSVPVGERSDAVERVHQAIEVPAG